MIAKIVGTLLILMGIAFILNPERLRRKLQKKAVRKLRRYIFALTSVVGVMLISAAWQYQGVLPKILMAIGVVAILKGFFFLKSKSAEKLTAWLLVQPTLVFRILALVQVALGLLVFFGLRGE